MKKEFILILFVTCLMNLGMNFHHPVTPTLFTELDLPSSIFGVSFAAMCLGSFVASVFWGEASNAFGRVKVFTFICIGYGISQLGLGISYDETSVIICRFIAGLFASGGLVSTLAYVVDVSDINMRSRNLSIYTACTLAAAAFGFLIGGVIGNTNYYIAFYTQAVWMVLVGILGHFIIKEVYVVEEKVSVKQIMKKANPIKSIVASKSYVTSAMVIFLVVIFLTSFASSAYDNAFNYYLKDQLNFPPVYNGLMKAVIGIIGLISNFTINMWIIKHTDQVKSLFVVLLVGAVSSILAAYTGLLVLFIIFNLVFFGVNSIYQPIVQSVFIEKNDPKVAGILSGVYSGVKSLGLVFGSLSAGYIYGFGFTLPFILAGAMFTLSLVFIKIYQKKSALKTK